LYDFGVWERKFVVGDEGADPREVFVGVGEGGGLQENLIDVVCGRLGKGRGGRGEESRAGRKKSRGGDRRVGEKRWGGIGGVKGAGREGKGQKKQKTFCHKLKNSFQARVFQIG
jgi:hypothetical protein